jgi:hemolysin D
MSGTARHWEVFKSAWKSETQRQKKLVHVDEPEFLPAALEIAEQPISPTVRAVTWVLLAGLLFAGLWSWFGKVDVVASAQGKLLPRGNVKLIQWSGTSGIQGASAIVRAIHVTEGQHVTAGQLLVELDPTVSGAEEAQARAALMTAENDATRSRHILRGLAGSPARTALNSTQSRLAAASVAETRARIAALEDARAQAQADLTAAQEEYAKVDESLPLLEEQLAARKELLEKGLTPRLLVLQLEQQKVEMLKNRNIARAQSAKARADMARISQEMTQAIQESRKTALTDLSRAETDAMLRREELAKAQQQTKLQRLTAPISGTVQQLQIHTLGGVVEPAKPIMVIVPDNSDLIVEAKILNKDAGFVKRGDAAAIKIEAYPFTKYGTLPATVEYIASDAVPDETIAAPQGPQLVYLARLKLHKTSLSDNGKTLRLTPGMTITADIKTGERRILEYLLSPISKTTHDAGRER